MKKIKLTIELVPKTCWFSNVRSAVTPEDWDKIRKTYAKKAQYLCQICGGKGPKWPVECHEIWNYDDKNKIQTLEEMISLCPACHEVKHMGLARVRNRENEAVAHLAKINGWRLKEAETYVEDQFEVWDKRSLHNWKLNLDFLTTLGISVTVAKKER